ncbi:hypothetical protein CYMTET_8279 [Cymbomonas tetramitiformis]|uniref:BED-type domain-containing protein n=1 Tax=Cymbomonas tetramitiformis TaxID=36881 RepID=A0AAE0GV73_9CHLO|nr:hypothetical protein CYMTET_8279 [Cymbomonas tetramitiformis]
MSKVCVMRLFADEEESEFQAPGADLRSPFWKHFMVRMEGKKIAEYVCILCGPDASPKEYCGNTSILRNHLAHCHKSALLEIKERDLPDNAEDAHSSDKNFSAKQVRHTGPELEEATKKACASMGIGVFSEVVARGDEEEELRVDIVSDSVHCTVSDNASNIVNGWTCFDGHECADHTIALAVKAFLEQQRVKKVFSKLRGMTGYFNHSIIGAKLLYDCQKRSNLSETKPPQDNDTRSGWGGACKQAKWYMDNRVRIRLLYCPFFPP